MIALNNLFIPLFIIIFSLIIGITITTIWQMIRTNHLVLTIITVFILDIEWVIFILLLAHYGIIQELNKIIVPYQLTLSPY
jgi:hypothetical protein